LSPCCADPAHHVPMNVALRCHHHGRGLQRGTLLFDFLLPPLGRLELRNGCFLFRRDFRPRIKTARTLRGLIAIAPLAVHHKQRHAGHKNKKQRKSQNSGHSPHNSPSDEGSFLGAAIMIPNEIDHHNPAASLAASATLRSSDDLLTAARPGGFLLRD